MKIPKDARKKRMGVLVGIRLDIKQEDRENQKRDPLLIQGRRGSESGYLISGQVSTGRTL